MQIKISRSMKFTKQQAFENLKGALTEGGKTLRLTERSINEMLETLTPLLATEETELTDFMSKALPLFKTANGNMEKDYSDFVQSYKSQTTSPATQQTTQKPAEGTSELEKRLAQLEQELQAEKREKVISQKKQDLKGKLKTKGVKNDSWINDFIQEINITEDFDVDAKLDSYVKIYNQSQANFTTSMSPQSLETPSAAATDTWDDIKKMRERKKEVLN